MVAEAISDFELALGLSSLTFGFEMPESFEIWDLTFEI